MKETGAIRLIFNWIFQWATTLDHSFQNEIIFTNPIHSFLLVATDKYGYKWWVSLRAVSLFSITTVASVADVVCWFWMLNFLYTDIGIGCGLKWLFVFDCIRYGYFFFSLVLFKSPIEHSTPVHTMAKLRMISRKLIERFARFKSNKTQITNIIWSVTSITCIGCKEKIFEHASVIYNDCNWH